MAKCNIQSRIEVEKKSRGWSRKDVVLKIANMLKTGRVIPIPQKK